MTPKEPHVSGWKPDFLPAEDQFTRQADQLRSMVGQQVAAVWVVWNIEHDRWFADLPVVLQLQSSQQLEVCWEKFDDLSITWNTIDTAVTPHAWVEWPLEWRREALPPLASVVGSLVRELAASRFLFTTQNLDRPHDQSSAWLTNGLWIGTAGAGLHIFNALDENGVSSEHPLRDEQHNYREI